MERGAWLTVYETGFTLELGGGGMTGTRSYSIPGSLVPLILLTLIAHAGPPTMTLASRSVAPPQSLSTTEPMRT
jgi:hypothetical protein